jgi:hypothetical protein
VCYRYNMLSRCYYQSLLVLCGRDMQGSLTCIKAGFVPHTVEWHNGYEQSAHGPNTLFSYTDKCPAQCALWLFGGLQWQGLQSHVGLLSSWHTLLQVRKFLARHRLVRRGGLLLRPS